MVVVVLMVVGKVGGVDCKKCFEVRVRKKGGEVFLFYILFFSSFSVGVGVGKDRYQGYFSASSFFFSLLFGGAAGGRCCTVLVRRLQSSPAYMSRSSMYWTVTVVTDTDTPTAAAAAVIRVVVYFFMQQNQMYVTDRPDRPDRPEHHTVKKKGVYLLIPQQHAR